MRPRERRRSFGFTSEQFLQNPLLNWLENLFLQWIVFRGAPPLIVLELLEGGLLFRRHLFDRDRPAVCDGSKSLPDIGLDLIRMIVFVTGLAHLAGIISQSSFHTWVLVDEGILWVVVGYLQLFRLEHLFDGLARATANSGGVLCLGHNRGGV